MKTHNKSNKDQFLTIRYLTRGSFCFKIKQYPKNKAGLIAYQNLTQEVAIAISWIKMEIIAENISGVNGVPQRGVMELVGARPGVLLKIMLIMDKQL